MDLKSSTFELKDSFFKSYIGKQPEWGPLGYVVYKRTYARPIESITSRYQGLAEEYKVKTTEEFWLTLLRVIEGIYRVQEAHCKHLRLPWNPKKAQKSAQSMYKLMWDFKFLPPGRGLWAIGTDAIESKGGAAANNCCFVSTENLDLSFSDPFCFLMDMSMLGVGVGADVRGAGKVTIKKPRISQEIHQVPDTREGWVDLVRRHLDAYVGLDTIPKDVDYSAVRVAGTPIKGFGGVASGPQPLIELIDSIKKVLDELISEPINSTALVDIFNLIGRCVVAGNIRRSAELMLGFQKDKDFLQLKNPKINKEAVEHHRWSSNNSILVNIGEDYTEASVLTASNGEPGYEWIENARAYSRMIDPPDYKDAAVLGINPCQPQDATLLTPNGISTIEKVSIGDLIWTGQRFSKVKNKWSTGIKPVYEYHTRAGIFLGTENHRVVSEGEKIEVKDSSTIDICIGPTIHIQNEENLECIIDGLVLGDGGIHKASNNLVGLYIGTKDQDYFNHSISKLISKWRPGISPTFYEVKTSITKDELTHTYNRKIPDRYLYCNPSKQSSFLKGLYSANGSIVNQRITLKSSSFNLIKDTQQILSALGIRSYYTINKAHDVEFNNGTYECKKSYDLNISTDRIKFRDQIGFLQQYKKEKLDQICNETNKSKYACSRPKSTYEITEIIFRGDEPVFDLEVEAEEHTYWTGGLLVSNCGEIPLENMELCNLVEVFPSRHSSYEELEVTLKFAYLYAKTVSLIPTHNERTNAVMMRNRRIGTSQSGIIEAFNRHGKRVMLNWCNDGYKYIKALDKIYSKWLCVPESIKTCTVKPSGSVSLLPGVTPGIHHPHSEYYFRVVRFATDSPLVEKLKKANYQCINLDPEKEPNTTAVYFAVKERYFSKSKSEVSLWEQLEIAAQYQAYWADNQVSCTVTFKSEEAKDIKPALELYETRLKGISFLPLETHGYEHAPYQKINEEEYLEYTSKLKKLNLSTVYNEVQERFCDGDSCMIGPAKKES